MLINYWIKKTTFNSAFVGQNIIEIEQKLTWEYFFEKNCDFK